MVRLLNVFLAWRAKRRRDRDLLILEQHVMRLRRAKVVRMPHHSTKRNGTEAVP